MTRLARLKTEKSVSRFMKMHWRIFIQCCFLVTIVLGILSVILLQLDLAFIYSIEFEVTVRIVTSITVALVISGCIGLLQAYNEAIKYVEEKYKSALQEARGTERYYHAWNRIAREKEEKERKIFKDLNPLLLAAVLIIAPSTSAYVIAAYPKPHPFYPLLAISILSIFLAAFFLHGRKSGAR